MELVIEEALNCMPHELFGACQLPLLGHSASQLDLIMQAAPRGSYPPSSLRLIYCHY